MRKQMVGLAALGAACAVSADVVTNAWISPGGGSWFATNEVGVLVNWAGDLTDTNAVMYTVADFALTNDAAIVWSDKESVASAGMIFRPLEVAADVAADGDTGAAADGDADAGATADGDADAEADAEANADAEDAAEAAWPTWRLRGAQKGDRFALSTAALGFFPLRVEDGWLVLGDNLFPSPSKAAGYGPSQQVDYGPVRKEGNGAVRVSAFYRAQDAGGVLAIDEGAVMPMTDHALAYTDVRVTGPAGRFVFTNYAAKATVGALAPQAGVPLPLNGVELRMGTLAAAVVPGEVCGTGRVTALVRSVFVTNVVPGVVYGASAGRLRLDTTDAAAVPFASWDFEDSLTADTSGNGRDLTASGAVARVYDAERGGHVARFTATATTGGSLVVSVPDAEALTGDADYTISLWAKAAAPCANNWPTFLSIGREQVEHSLVQFRFTDGACTNLLLGHWNDRGDFSKLVPAPGQGAWDPAAWHHYAAVREGNRCAVWVDGRKVFEKRDTGLQMTLPATAQIQLGWMAGSKDRYFHGDLDDVRIYAHALDAVGVERLFAGGEPVQDGKGRTRGAAPALPEGTRLALDLNGQIQLAGAQTLAATNVTATGPRGALDLPDGGTLTLTGAGAYPAGVSGTGRFVKDGDGRLVLGGALTQTGGTEVRAGALVLQNAATQPLCLAVYDFEQSLGADSGGCGLNLTTQAGVERVWDDERGGWVAQFPGTAGQRLEAWLYGADLLVGDADYTLSVWAKPDADCPATGTLLSIGGESSFKEIVFRFNAIDSGTMVLSHWGVTLDFPDVTTPAAPQGAWHHYAAVRRGASFTVYVDGAATWTTEKAQALGLEPWRSVCLGRQLNKTDRQFKGRLDDVAVYACALEADQIARLSRRLAPRAVARGARPDALVQVPDPVLHYAFERADAPGFDSASGAHHLVKEGGGALTLVASPLGGTALQFDAYNRVCLKSAAFPDVIPTDGGPFTVSLWVQAAPADVVTDFQWSTSHAPSFICWGSPSSGQIGYMLSFMFPDSNAAHGFATPRCYVGLALDPKDNKPKEWNFAAVLPGLRDGEPLRRWHHYATVYDRNAGVRNYVDGVYQPAVSLEQAFTPNAIMEGNVFYLGAKTTAPDALFRGALDEVKVFAAALNARQVRAVMRADAGALRVLPAGGDVAVAEGATLEVNGTAETLGALSGKGAVDLVSGTLALTNASSAFEGTLAGEGTLRLEAGAALALAANPTAFTGYVELAGGTLALPEGVRTIPATFRVTPIDTARETVCAGDAEIPDGTALAAEAAYRGPFVTARGRVVVCGGGTVALADPSAVGTWTIARGEAGVRDDGAGALADRWRVANLPALRTARFQVSGDTFTCTVSPSGTLLLIR